MLLVEKCSNKCVDGHDGQSEKTTYQISASRFGCHVSRICLLEYVTNPTISLQPFQPCADMKQTQLR